MYRQLNKKGDSETSGLLIWTVVIIIAAAIVLFFFYGGFETIANWFKAAPETLEVATQACILVAKPETRSSYCDQFREVKIAGEMQLVNCQYPEIQKNLDLGGQEIECRVVDNPDALKYKERGIEYCKVLFKGNKVKENTKVNDVVCSTLTCQDLGGAPAGSKGTDACKDRNDARSKAITKGFDKEQAKTSVCCVKP